MNFPNQQMPASFVSRQFTDKEMKRYFAKIPKGTIKAIVVGAILFLIGLTSQLAVLLILGLIVVGISLAVIFAVIGGSKPTDQEYDFWLEEQAQRVINQAAAKLGLDLSQVPGEPLQIHSFVLFGKDAQSYRADELRWKVGKDGKLRFSVNIYTRFFPAEHHLAVFASDINALNQSAHNVKTEEYFYEDIVGATTGDEQDYFTIKDKNYQYRTQRFALKINSGDSIGATIGATPTDNKQNLPTFAIPDSGVDRTVAQLRSLLRDKKQRRATP